MIFQTHIPKFPLNQFVDCFVYHKGYDPVHSFSRFLPDGNTEIIIDLTDTPKFIYDNENLKEIQACHNAWASGVRTEYITLPSGRDMEMFIIYFKKGMAYPLFPVPMNEISDTVLDSDLLWGMEFAFLREAILENIEKKFETVEEFLLKNFRSQPNINECVSYAVERIVNQPDQLSLGKLYEEIGYSRKHFIDLFKQHVGITPKAYLKIMRFQKTVIEIETQKEIDWVLIANDCGFYDQAHFINDFKLFSGFTPEEYLKRKDLLNYIPIG